MSKKKSTKLRPDVAETAFRTMLEATGQVEKTLPHSQRPEKNAEAASRGAKGGRRRKETLSPEQRSEIAKMAARKRWNRTERPED